MLSRSSPTGEARTNAHAFSKLLYGQRNRIERCLNKLKQFRRIATRYEKFAANFLAMIKIATVRIWLRACESPEGEPGARPVPADAAHQVLEEGADLGARRRLARAQEHRHRLAARHMVDVDRQEAAGVCARLTLVPVQPVKVRREGEGEAALLQPARREAGFGQRHLGRGQGRQPGVPGQAEDVADAPEIWDARTSASAASGRSRNRRAARCAPRARPGAAAPPEASKCPANASPGRYRPAADRPPAGDRRRTHRAAGSNSGRSSRGRSAPPGGRAPHRRSRRCPAQFLPAAARRRR